MGEDVDHPRAEEDPERDETPTERLDRNWGDLLQELRVSQTGVQLLTGFLLTLPFQSRFAELDRVEQNIYLGTSAAPSAPPGCSSRRSACTGSCSASTPAGRW